MNIKVNGGQTLSGEITPSGSKNSAVALIPASILFDKPITLQNVPDIKDVDRLVEILRKLGGKVNWDRQKNTMEIDNTHAKFENLDRNDLGSMRGTALLWGPMLARFKKVSFDELPGGCTLGARPLNPHYEAFKSLGVSIDETDQGVAMSATNAKANTVWLTEMSPTVTENTLMLASLLPGRTKIVGAASEPQVQDLCRFLIAAGVQINGVGSSVLEIEGVEALQPITFEMFSDHYEIATFLALGAVTGGEVKVHNALPELFPFINHVFAKFNVEIEYEGTTAIVRKDQNISLKEAKNGLQTIKAQPWPSLPVDILPLFIPLALKAKSGQVLFHNWMYEAGLFWTSELLKHGANVIMCDPHRVIVTTGNALFGATIEAPYIIRAVVAHVMTAMIAEGESTILNADALYRGHPHFAENLRRLGAKVEETQSS